MVVDISKYGQIPLNRQGQQNIQAALGPNNAAQTTRGTLGPSSTTLFNAGKQQYNAGTGKVENISSFGNLPLNKQINIPGPRPGPSQPSSPGGAPPYSPNVVNQTVEFGGAIWKGNPGEGWRFERMSGGQPTTPPPVGQLPPPPPLELAPPPAPPPSLPSQLAAMPTSPSGATALPGAAQTGPGGVAGMPFQGLTQQGQATSGLQLAGLPSNLFSLPQAAMKQLADLFSAPSTMASTQQGPTAKPQSVSKGELRPDLDKEGAVDVFGSMGSNLLNKLGIDRPTFDSALNAAGLFTGVKGVGKGLLGAGKALFKEGGDAGKALREGVGGMFSGLAVQGGAMPNEWMPRTAPDTRAEINRGQLGTPQAMTTSQLTDRGLQQTPIQMPTASQGNLMGSLPAQQHAQAIQMALAGQAPVSQVASAIASPEAQQTINKMLNQAARTGDMEQVSKLATLGSAVTQQLNFINQIGRIVSALAAGFGSMNAPGVTEQRGGMVERGLGESFTTPPTMSALGGDTGQGSQSLPFELPFFMPEQTGGQSLKPNITPFMPGGQMSNREQQLLQSNPQLMGLLRQQPTLPR